MVVPEYAPEQIPEERRRYELAEAEAKAKQIGLWRVPDHVARGIGAEVLVGRAHDEEIDGRQWTALKGG